MANMHLVTGFAGREHVTSIDQGLLNSYIFGDLEVVMERGNQFEASIISNNIIRVKDGDLLMQGRFARLNDDSYVDVTIDNGTQGYFRNDLIVARYQKDAITAVETVDLVVIKGENAASDPVDPAHVKGDIKSGRDFVNDVPLWRVSLDGLNVTGLTCLYSTFSAAPSGLLDYAAPTGYGLGMMWNLITDFNDTSVGTGWYTAAGETAVNYPSKYFAFAYGIVRIERRGNNITQTAISGPYSAVRLYNGSTWGEWNYVNPPMELGVEYRTTERYNGKAVYRKADATGNVMWRPESSTEWRIEVDTGNMESLGFPKIQTGSYTGTGTCGASNPCSLTFSFEPKMVIITGRDASLSEYDPGLLIWMPGNIGNGSYAYFSYSDKTLSWYSSNNSSGAIFQHNQSNITYNWVAIG